jgi:hypothetical protein
MLVLYYLVYRRVYVLIDSRRGVKEVDQDMMKRLNLAGLTYQVHYYYYYYYYYMMKRLNLAGLTYQVCY